MDKAKESCENAWQIIADHFADVSKKVKIWSETDMVINCVAILTEQEDSLAARKY